MCVICFSPSIAGTAIIAQISYGLGLSDNAAIKSLIDTQCTADWVGIPNAFDASAANYPMVAITATIAGTSKFCGRYFNAAAAATATETLCSKIFERYQNLQMLTRDSVLQLGKLPLF